MYGLRPLLDMTSCFVVQRMRLVLPSDGSSSDDCVENPFRAAFVDHCANMLKAESWDTSAFPGLSLLKLHDLLAPVRVVIIVLVVVGTLGGDGFQYPMLLDELNLLSNGMSSLLSCDCKVHVSVLIA